IGASGQTTRPQDKRKQPKRNRGQWIGEQTFGCWVDRRQHPKPSRRSTTLLRLYCCFAAKLFYQLVTEPSRLRKCGISEKRNSCRAIYSSLTSTPSPGPVGTAMRGPLSWSCCGKIVSS